MKVQNTTGLQFKGRVRDHEIVLDSTKKDLGGYDAGIQPMELILIGLIGCTGMDVVAILRKMRAEPRKFEIYIDAERAPEHPKVYTYVKLRYYFEGTDYDKAKKAVELSQNRYCPVSAMLRRSGARIDYEIEVKN